MQAAPRGNSYWFAHAGAADGISQVNLHTLLCSVNLISHLLPHFSKTQKLHPSSPVFRAGGAGECRIRCLANRRKR